jgi:hypothetical protein
MKFLIFYYKSNPNDQILSYIEDMYRTYKDSKLNSKSNSKDFESELKLELEQYKSSLKCKSNEVEYYKSLYNSCFTQYQQLYNMHNMNNMHNFPTTQFPFIPTNPFRFM